MTEPAEQAPGPGLVAASYGLVLLLTVLLALWGAFLVPFRVGGTLVPVSWVVALANLELGRAGGRLLGRRGAGVVGLVWVSVVLVLFSRGPGGDVVLLSTTAIVFLAIGVLASAAAYALADRFRAGSR